MRALLLLPLALLLACSADADAETPTDGCTTSADGSQCCPLPALDATCASEAYFSNHQAWTCDLRDGKATQAGDRAVSEWRCLVAVNDPDAGGQTPIKTPRGYLFCCNR